MPAPRPLGVIKPSPQRLDAGKKVVTAASTRLDESIERLERTDARQAITNRMVAQEDAANRYGTSSFKSTSVPYSTDGETAPVTQQAIKDINAKPNVLDNFANYTYHVVFSIVNEEHAKTATADTDLNSLSRIIIAESGATVGFNISSFTMTNTVSPGFKHQNQAVTEWKMTITEPYGLTFPDYMVLAAKDTAINVQNCAKFPYFLELWFTGYDENGNIVEPKVTRKVWRVMLLDFDVTTNQTGTVYNLTGIVDNNIGTANQFSMPSAVISLNGVNTFGGAMDALTKSLNDAAKKSENKDQSATTYKIILPDSVNMRDWAIERNPQDDQRSIDSIPINKGQDIGNFIMKVLSKCGTSAESYLRGTSPGGTAPSIDNNGLGRIVQLFTEVKLGKYDTDYNDYQKEITYRIVPFTTTRVVRDPDEAKKQSQIGIQRSKLQYLMDNNLLAKKYEYFYTGRNTDVIKFDVHVENFWAITLPTYLGGRTYGQATNGAVAAPSTQYPREVLGYSAKHKLAEEVSARLANPDSLVGAVPGNLSPSTFSQLSKNPTLNGLGNDIPVLSQAAGQVINSVGNTNMNKTLTALSSKANSILNSVDAIKAIKEEFANLSTLNSTPIPTFDTQQVTTPAAKIYNNLKTAGSAARVGPYADNPTLARYSQAAAASPGSEALRKSNYLEDIKPELEKDDPLLVSFLVDPEPTAQNSVNNGNETKNKMSADSASGQFAVGQSLWGATIANLYDNKFMLEIEIEIRGDPWWIGMTNLEENAFAANTSATVDDKANYLIGENMFLLTFKIGSNYNELTGLMDFNDNNDYFNGIYSVLEVENRFENGAFTQKLKAFKEMFSQKVNKEITPKSVQPTEPRDAAANTDVRTPKAEAFDYKSYGDNIDPLGTGY